MYVAIDIIINPRAIDIIINSTVDIIINLISSYSQCLNSTCTATYHILSGSAT